MIILINILDCFQTGSRKKSSNGFTLLELILVMVLLGFAAVLITPFVGNILTNLVESRELSHRENQAFLALERFVRDVRGADIVNWVSSSKMTLTFDDDDDLDYIIEADGVLKLNGQVLIKNLDTVESKFFETDLTNFSFYSLKLVVKINDNQEFDLSASAVQRKNLGGGP
jgi:prepilin-type N-terminal cleavage/methylation domain-containing protein